MLFLFTKIQDVNNIMLENHINIMAKSVLEGTENVSNMLNIIVYEKDSKHIENLNQNEIIGDGVSPSMLKSSTSNIRSYICELEKICLKYESLISPLRILSEEGVINTENLRQIQKKILGELVISHSRFRDIINYLSEEKENSVGKKERDENNSDKKY